METILGAKSKEKNIGRDSKWTSIYWGAHEGKMCAFVRLTPHFLEMERLGFPHGLSVSPAFPTEADAHGYAERIDAFMDAIVAAAGPDSHSV